MQLLRLNSTILLRFLKHFGCYDFPVFPHNYFIERLLGGEHSTMRVQRLL